MKRIAYLLTIVVILSVFAIKIGAEDDVDEYLSEFESVLPEEFSGIGEDPDELIDRVGIDGLVGEIISAFSNERTEITSFFLVLVGSIALTRLASILPNGASGGADIVLSLISSVLIFHVISSLYASVTQSLTKICDFFGSVIPITVGITALGGGNSTAMVQASGMYTTLSLVSSLGERIFTPLLALGLALGLLSSFGNEGVFAVGRGLKGLFMWIIGILGAILTAAISLQTLIASAVDSATIRAARYAASGLIPVVGSTVSSALSTLASGLSYAKGIVGGGAIAVLILMALSPLVLLLLYRLALSLSIILADFTGAKSIGGVFSSFRFSLDMLISVYALSALIFVFEILLFIKMGGVLA